MATFTRIIQEHVGAVSAINTYSMRGDFKPADALAALEAIGRKAECVTIKVDIAPAYESLKRYEAAMDERTRPEHFNCRSTVGYGADNAPSSRVKFKGLGIQAMRRLLKGAVERGAPMAERRSIQRRIHYLLGKGPLSPKANRKVRTIRKRNRARK